MKEETIDLLMEKADESINKALVYIEFGTKHENKTMLLNAHYNLARFHAFLDIIGEIDMNTMCSIGEQTEKDRDKILKAIDVLYQ